VYLVGDPVQLPATVISSTALEQGYDVSMFKRLQASGYPVNVLDVQYRMHPAISLFPSQEFYQGRLKDGEVRVSMRNAAHAMLHMLHAV
jgi:senataxin